MKRKIIVLAAALLLTASRNASAQSFSVSTNLLDWANFATLNLDAGVAAGRHTEFVAGFRYNPWHFGSDETLCCNRARTISAGLRLWPWYVWSGWWASVRLQTEEYSRGGIFNMKYMEEGRALGAGLSGGYSLMVGRRLNLEFSLGIWGGWRWYDRYSGQPCGRLTGSGSGPFVLPSGETRVALSYLF